MDKDCCNEPEVKIKATHHLVVYEKATDTIAQCFIGDLSPSDIDIESIAYDTRSFMLPERDTYVGKPLIELEEIDGSDDPNTIGWDESGKAIKQ